MQKSLLIAVILGAMAIVMQAADLKEVDVKVRVIGVPQNENWRDQVEEMIIKVPVEEDSEKYLAQVFHTGRPCVSKNYDDGSSAPFVANIYWNYSKSFMQLKRREYTAQPVKWKHPERPNHRLSINPFDPSQLTSRQNMAGDGDHVES